LPGRRGSNSISDVNQASQAKGPPVSVLIGILITFLVIFLVLYLINMLPLDGRAKQIARVVVIIIGIISLLKYLAVF
jgi:glucan phosphoethanolaminetransferase (alkaline phosphatase superfamily)